MLVHYGSNTNNRHLGVRVPGGECYSSLITGSLTDVSTLLGMFLSKFNFLFFVFFSWSFTLKTNL